MRVEFIDPFIRAGFSVLETLVRDRPERGSLSMRAASFTTQQVTIMVGVNGAVSGTVMYGMSLVTAQKIAASLTGQAVREMDDLAWSAIAELGNIISGNAVKLLYEAGHSCEITPPSVLRGMNVQVSTFVPAVVVPMSTKCGRIEINVALAETDAMAKAA